MGTTSAAVSPETGDNRAVRGNVAALPPAPGRLRFTLLHKLALTALLGNLPVVVLGVLFFSAANKDIDFVTREAKGASYLAAVWPVFDATLRDTRPTTADGVALVEAGGLYDEELATSFFRERFQELAETGGPQAMTAGRTLIRRIADNSGLSVDSDLNTLEAVSIISTKLPEVAALAYELQNSLSGDVTAEDKQLAVERFERARQLLAESLAGTDALNFNTELTRSLSAAQIAINRAATDYAAAANAVPIDLAGDQPPPDDLVVAYAAFQSALGGLWNVAREALDVLLVSRLGHLKAQLSQELAFAAGLYIAVAILTWLLSRSIAGRVRVLMRFVETMRRGQLYERAPFTTARDEIGDMARAVEVFRIGLLDKRVADEALIRRNEALQRQRQTLATQNIRFDAALNNMSQGLAMFDGERRLVVSNRRFAEIHGLKAEQLQPGTPQERVDELTLSRTRYAESARTARDPDGDASFNVELDDGRVLFVSQRRMQGGGWVVTHEDITQRRRAEAQVAYMAHHDALTMLPNRVLFRQKLDDALGRRRPDEWVAVLFLDLDHFKGVNDTLGHPVGDALLKVVAERLAATLGERATVARLSGDEFAILDAGIEQPLDAGDLAVAIVETVAEPYEIHGHHIAIGTSVGIVVAPHDGDDADLLLKNADLALYRAKADGRGTHRFFEAGMDAELQARRLLELDLRKALAIGEFEMHFQPLVALAQNRIKGFEALLRWRHPRRGMVSPAEFVPLAEETGLIVPLGEWILKAACTAAVEWPEDISIAVNLSPAQFRSRRLVEAVVDALELSGLRPERLELEITESVLLHDNQATLATLHRLRALGVRISMDDFGTGYSSLSYLRSFPFDKIKIDQSFIHDLDDKEDSAAIVRAVASLGQSLGMTTTAEGVETSRQLEVLRAEGYTEVQGYLFSRPLPAADVLRLLTEHNGPIREAQRA